MSHFAIASDCELYIPAITKLQHRLKAEQVFKATTLDPRTFPLNAILATPIGTWDFINQSVGM
jgi:hypothetical protein